jgi:hypothetical protein
MAPEQREQTEEQAGDAGDARSDPEPTKTSNGSTIRRAAAGGALAAAAGTTVYFTRKAMRGNHRSGKIETLKSQAEKVKSQADKVESVGGADLNKMGSRVDDFFTVLRTRGWDAANDMLIPVAENAARAAGAYAAENSPDLVRDTLLPKFVDGFTEAHQAGEKKSGES